MIRLQVLGGGDCEVCDLVLIAFLKLPLLTLALLLRDREPLRGHFPAATVSGLQQLRDLSLLIVGFSFFN